MPPTRERPVLPILILAVLAAVACKTGGAQPDTDPTASGASRDPGTSSGETSGESDSLPTQDVDRAWQPVEEPEVERLSSTPELMAARYNEEGVLRDIFFGFDKAELSDTARRTLALNAGWLRTHPAFGVLVEGHCDERGTEEYNLALGEERANAARSYLVSLGIAEERIRTISYGEERPVDEGHNESAWSKNRRAHFVVQPR